MCLSIPAKVISIKGEEALVSVFGTQVSVSLVLLEGIEPGDFVLVHSGFAIQTIDQEEAKKTLEVIRHMQAEQKKSQA